MVPPTNTQSILNNMVPNVKEASSSHNVFNERLEDVYFDASTMFHDPSNMQCKDGLDQNLGRLKVMEISSPTRRQGLSFKTEMDLQE
ncbi:hypothetical protein Tco_0433346 [Tanacetum coccineum]